MRGRAGLLALSVAPLLLVGCGGGDRSGTIYNASPSCSYTNHVARITNAPSSLARVNFNYASSTAGGAQTDYHTVYGATDSNVPSWARYVSIFMYDSSGSLLLSWTFVGCS